MIESLYETLTQLEIAKRLGYISGYVQAESLGTDIRRMLISIMKKLRGSAK